MGVLGRFLAVQAAAVAAAGVLIPLPRVPELVRASPMPVGAVLADAVKTAFVLLLLAAPAIVATSCAAALCRRVTGRVPLIVVVVLAAVWSLLALGAKLAVTPVYDLEAADDGPGLGAFLLIASCALVPLLAAWWWTRPARQA